VRHITTDDIPLPISFEKMTITGARDLDDARGHSLQCGEFDPWDRDALDQEGAVASKGK
jgi:hypothetical protein